MRITLQVTCDSAEEAQKIINRLAAPDNTWVEQLDKGDPKPPKTSTSVPAKAVEAQAPYGPETERPNMSPGEPTIGKIGAGTREALLEAVANGDEILPKYTEHMKLLWKRNEVKYDGTSFYN